MGHTRLGYLPRSRKWKEVIGLIAAGAGADQIANAIIRAAESGLMAAAHHTGLVEAFWSLTQLTQAAREQDFAAGLRTRGFNVPDNPSLPAILSAVSQNVDKAMPNNKGRTDLGEMAQSAAIEVTNQLVTGKASSLFGATAQDVQRAFRELGTEKNFGELGKQFFGQLTNKVLQFYASRECANHVGQGQRFANLAAKAAFDDAMGLHCRQASVIVQKFAGDWQSKQNWQNRDTGGITKKHAEGFAHQAMKKMVAELKEGNK
ncbi:MAG: hypothetical protein HUU19_07620 [Phycisphaerales bacterium]|nr:hypothetical protein [Phycisphaerales bacterium]